MVDTQPRLNILVNMEYLRVFNIGNEEKCGASSCSSSHYPKCLLKNLAMATFVHSVAYLFMYVYIVVL